MADYVHVVFPLPRLAPLLEGYQEAVSDVLLTEKRRSK